MLKTNQIFYLHILYKYIPHQRLKLNSTTVIGKIREMPRSLFYNILCYVTMDYKKWYVSLLLKHVRTPCISRSELCQLHVDFTFQMWCWPSIFRLNMYQIKEEVMKRLFHSPIIFKEKKFNLKVKSLSILNNWYLQLRYLCFFC